MQLNMFTPRSLSIGAIQGFPNQYSRTYNMRTTQGNLDDLLRATNNGLNVNVNTITQASDVIGMNSEAVGIDIDGGWDENRHIIQMVLESETNGSLYILTGFTTTDYMIGGRANPNALVRFNTFTEMAPRQDHMGNVSYVAVATDNVMAQTRLNGNLELSHAVTVCPSDVLSASSMYGMSDGDNMGTLNQLSTRGSTARNNQAAAWLGRSLNTFVDQMDSMGMDSHNSYMAHSEASTICNHAANNAGIAETDLATAPLIGSLLGQFHDLQAGQITWGYLLQRLPQLEHLLQPPVAAGGGQHIKLEEWNNRDSAMVISEYASAIPALMLELGIAYLDHTISNSNSGFSPDPMNASGNSFQINGNINEPGITFSVPSVNEAETLSRLEVRIREMIFPRISKGHQMTISCRASLFSDMTIIVNWNGVEFAHSSPTFASSMWSAMSADVNSSTNLANGMGKLAETLVDSRGNGVGAGSGGISTSTPGFGVGQTGQNAKTDWL